MSDWPLDRARRVDVLLGAAILVRRSALDRVGLLDEDYFIYSEEVDLCYRLGRAGYEIRWVPEAVVMHHGGQSTRQVALPMFLRLYQGKVLYFRKNHGQTAARTYKAILLLAALPRLIYQALAQFESGGRREAHLTIARSYRRLIAALPSM
jgi:GT2 family glycosyltransferase